MLQHQIEIQIITVLVATSCVIPGILLILRKMAMMTDAISHSILLGIVVGFLFVSDITSPILILGATLSGVLTVFLVETLNKKRYVNEDASIGLVFPFLFSIGIILIGVFACDVHLDIHAVLLGELTFAPFDRLYINGADYGPKSFYVMGTILIINILFISIFYKELKISTFDPALAATFRFFPHLINIGLMTIVSITCVGAFDAVGSILVIALMVVPPCCAYLLTDSFSKMFIISIVIGILCSIVGFWVAIYLNANIAGSMAVVCGIAFSIVFIFAPSKGLLAVRLSRSRQKWNFSRDLLLIHLFNHEGSPEYDEESRIDHLYKHLLWKPQFGLRVVNMAEKDGNLTIEGENLFLTDSGRKKVERIKAEL